MHDFAGVVGEMRESNFFSIHQVRLYPFLLPTHHLNLIACLRCTVLGQQ